MKKTVFALALVCLLLLSGCQKAPVESETTGEPTPTPSQEAEIPSVQSPADKGDENDILPRFLREFVFTHFDTQIPDCPWLASITRSITPADREELLDLIALDTWWEATDIPAGGMEGLDTLYDDAGHLLVFGYWEDDRCLILVKDGEEDYLYFAPPWVTGKVAEFTTRKAFLPDFILDFNLDLIEIDVSPNENRQNLEVYVLDKGEQGSLLDALNTESWTVARGNELAAEYFTALTVRDPKGNSLVLAPWDEEKCLVNCFYANDDIVVRYWAPVSVLENVQGLVKALTPLGTIDKEALRYFNLFRNDWGFNMLIRDATKRGNISDDQMAAYVFYVTDYNDEVGISPEDVDAVTQKHFGRKMGSYDTAWSNILPSGNMTPSGWDFHAACYPILTGASDMDEYGNISATFKVYTVWDDFWDTDLPRAKLKHMREYLLTGNDSDYLANPNVYLSTVSITFRIETEQDTNGVWEGYLFYDSVARVD